MCSMRSNMLIEKYCIKRILNNLYKSKRLAEFIISQPFLFQASTSNDIFASIQR